MIFHLRSLAVTIIAGISLNILFTYKAVAQYKRCWLENGVVTINCAPADGYFFINKQNIYKKCPIVAGSLEKSCNIEDGYGLFYKNYHWYQCPVQQGKKLDHCTLASGYQIVKLHQTFLKD